MVEATTKKGTKPNQQYCRQECIKGFVCGRKQQKQENEKLHDDKIDKTKLTITQNFYTEWVMEDTDLDHDSYKGLLGKKVTKCLRTKKISSIITK